MRLEVSIDGSPKYPLIKGSSFSFGIGETAKATLRFYSTDPDELDLHQAVTVSSPSNGSTIFLGFIVSLRAEKPKEMGPGQWLVTATCLGREWLLSFPPALYTAVHQSASNQYILIAMIIACGLTDDIKYIIGIATGTTGGGIPGGPDIVPGGWLPGGEDSPAGSTVTIQEIATAIDVAYATRTPREVADDMAQTTGGVWYVDLDTFYFNETGTAGAAAWNVDNVAPDGAASFRVFALDVERHWEKPMTHVTVLGQFDGLRQARATASVSGTPARTFARVYESDAILTDAMAQAVADALIATAGDEEISASWMFVEPTEAPALKVNTLMSVTDAEHGLSAEEMIVRSVTMTQEDGEQTRYKVTAGDIRPTYEALLRRIEAANRRRQQNLPQLIRGIDFDGTDDYIASAASIAAADDLEEFTILATIRPDLLTSTMTVVSKENGSGRGWVLEVRTTSLALVRTKDSTNYEYSRVHGFVAGGIYRIVVRSSATSGVRMWVNGAEMTSGGGSSLGSGDFDSEADGPVRVGRQDSGQYFNGFLATVVVWDFAMPETTCPNIHNLKVADLPVESSIVLAWEMGEFNDGSLVTGTGAIRDSSGNDFHGSPSGGPSGAAIIYQS